MPNFIAKTGQKVEMIILADGIEIILRNSEGEVISTTRANRIDAAELMISLTEMREA